MTPSKRRRATESVICATDRSWDAIDDDMRAIDSALWRGAQTSGPTPRERLDATRACMRAIGRLERLALRIERLECDGGGARK